MTIVLRTIERLREGWEIQLRERGLSLKGDSGIAEVDHELPGWRASLYLTCHGDIPRSPSQGIRSLWQTLCISMKQSVVPAGC